MPKIKYSPDGSTISDDISVKNADTVGGKSPGTGADNVLLLDSNGKVPLANIPTPLTGKDADTVDNCHAGTGANNVLKLDSSGKVPLANIPTPLTGKDADTVDGCHAGTAAGNVLKLDGSGKVSYANLPTIIPAGVIVMWSGSTASIPSGWALCNGQNGTPDLRDRFIVGAGSSYTVGETGGSITKNTSTITRSTTVGNDGIPELVASSDHYHSIDVRPPYYALAYIMKL